MKMKRVFDVAAIILVIGGFILCLINLADFWAFKLQNPDMTDMRHLMEYPRPAIASLCSILAMWCGSRVLKG